MPIESETQTFFIKHNRLQQTDNLIIGTRKDNDANAVDNMDNKDGGGGGGVEQEIKWQKNVRRRAQDIMKCKRACVCVNREAVTTAISEYQSKSRR